MHPHEAPGGKLRRTVTIPVLCLLALVGSACGGEDDMASGDGSVDEAGAPVEGGTIVYGLENESSGGWCLPESQLAISGIQVARTVYDTLTAPNEDDEYVPFLAESLEPNDDYTRWTMTLRDGVSFHDGTPLTAEVVKNNLDAYRGKYPGLTSMLFVFVLEDIESVEVVDDLTLTLTTSVPWPALPSALYGSGRIGILAQAQLDDPETCDRNLIGTGPFKLDEWEVNDHLTVSKNPDYWMTDGNGTRLPYLDRIEYRPIIEESARVNALESGQLQAMHTNDAASIEQVRSLTDAGSLKQVNTDRFAEVSYLMFNTTKAPFDSLTARRAVAEALDRDEMRSVVFLDQMTMASGPFAPGVAGYLDDTGFPTYDRDGASALAEQYEQETGSPLEFAITFSNSAATLQITSFIQDQMARAGIKVTLDPIEQSQQISTALGDDWQVQYWRNHPGGDPDTQYYWWYGGSPVNFGKFKEPEIDALLDEGRSMPEQAGRSKVYQDVNRVFAEKLYNVWTNWSNWTIGTSTGIGGVLGPDLPDGSAPFPGLATGHPVSGMWMAQ